jgi:hypothetical protein
VPASPLSDPHDRKPRSTPSCLAVTMANPRRVVRDEGFAARALAITRNSKRKDKEASHAPSHQ